MLDQTPSRGRHSARVPPSISHRAPARRRLGIPMSVALTAVTAALLLAVAVLYGAPADTRQPAVAAGVSQSLEEAGKSSSWKERRAERVKERRARIEARAAARAEARASASATPSPAGPVAEAAPEPAAQAPAPVAPAQQGSTAASTVRPAGQSGLPYGAGSFFRSRVTGAPVDAARTSQFRAFMASHPDQAGIDWPKINVNPDWAMSYHVGTANDPVWRLAGGNTSDPRLAVLRTQGFHMADSVADSFPTGDQDRPGVMVDTVFGYTVQFADAVPNKATRTITVSNAGIMWHGSNGLDGRNPASDDERNFTSRGRIPDAMVIRRDQLDQAIANGTGLGHVLHLFFVETNTADGVVHPMTGAEGDKAGWGAEGERIRIRPDLDLEARGLTGAALAIARTLQEHGAYIGDNSGSSTQIKASQPHHYSGTNLTTDALKGKISWADFEVIPRGWQG
ncbi:hypothetical protein QOZ88_14160 [Blastococcus sp. BMG 814]|uniref:Uncharacterized protein n=1 Tax=Blastococcus carthaginiensis TaxID=3050034 RepID=A0ABT9IDW7_9ACTN|nr:hypothetical protein [Blastococcus carthaginiensis]MDP5183779.1 hypothetical protein [Blastococcus carthaginiensis]